MSFENDVAFSMSAIISYIVLLFMNVHLFKTMVQNLFPDMSEDSIIRMIGMITFIMDD